MEKLPTKTKIAAWWMIVIWGACAPLLLLGKYYVHLVGHLVVVISGCLLFTRRRKYWYLASVLLTLFSIWLIFFPLCLLFLPGVDFFFYLSSALAISPILSFGLFLLHDYIYAFIFAGHLFVTIPVLVCPLVIPLILLLLDRKNFWKVAR